MADFRFKNPITVLTDLGGISIDVTDGVVENYDSIVSQNPIESGSPVTDHVTILPVKITIEGSFSDIKISKLVGPIITQQAIKGLSKIGIDNLLLKFVDRKVFDIMNGVHAFKSMLFKSIQVIDDDPDFSLKFKAELWQIRKVSLVGNKPEPLSVYVSRAAMLGQVMQSSGTVSAPILEFSLGIIA